MSIVKRILKVIAVIAALFIVCGFIAGVVLIFRFYPVYEEYREDAVRAVEESDADTFMKNLSSYIYDDSGNLICKFAVDGNSDYLNYEDIPREAVNAFVAIEDRKFWEHKGYDPKGILRVCWRYVVTGGEEKHGASTITQQLARSVFLDNQVSLERKAREILTAVELEKKYSKEQILEFYINSVYFSNQCYGIEAAAMKYFSKSADELNLSEIAYLCAVPNAPSYYDPLSQKEHAVERRDKILDDMLECGYITKYEQEQAKAYQIVLNPQTVEKIQNYETTYAVDCAVRYLMRLDGFSFQYEFENMEDYQSYLKNYNETYEIWRGRFYTGGYVAETSLNEEKQKLLQDTVDETLAFSEEVSEDGIYELQSASTVVDNQTHKVVAVVGGRSQDTEIYTLNRAYQSYRQPGSTFKPLAVYAPALDHGYTADSVLQNINITKAKEKGLGAAHMTGSRMRLDKAVEKSVNGCAWWLFCNLTPKTGLSCVSRMEFSRIVPDDYYPASALGGLTYGVTTVEMAGGYSVLANQGMYYRVDCLTSLKDRNGKELYREEDPMEVYSPGAASEMVEIMKGVITQGTAASMKWDLEVEAAGKTGTTNECRDGWFCGITPDYSMSVWVGYDEPRLLENLYGATYPAAIWKNVMSELVRESTNLAFAVPETEEEEETEAVFAQEGAGDYYSYLPGRDDSEVLSSGYTVKNYREDHMLADQAEALMYQLETLDPGAEDYEEQRRRLYEEAKALVEQIYSRKLYGTESEKLKGFHMEEP